MAEVILRRGTPADAPGIARIEQECFATPWSEESLRHDLETNGNAQYFVAEWGDEASGYELAGYIGLWIIAGEGNINNVAVRPKFRRNHIATQILDTMLEETGREGILAHTLEVRADNTPAINLYAGKGFTEAGQRPGYYQEDGMTAIIMWRSTEC